MLSFLAITTVIAFFIKGLSGFGPALVIIPVFGFFLPFTEVVPISGALLLLSNLPLAFKSWGSIRKRSFLPAAIGFGLGVTMGGRLLVILPESVLKHILGFALIGFCVYQLWGGRNITQRPDLTPVEQARLLFFAVASGLIVGAVGAGALPLIVYLGLRYPKENFRILLTYVFLVGSCAQVAVYSAQHLYQPHVISTTLWLIIPMFLGLWLGSLAFGKVQQKLFNRVVGVLLILPAINLLFS